MEKIILKLIELFWQPTGAPWVMSKFSQEKYDKLVDEYEYVTKSLQTCKDKFNYYAQKYGRSPTENAYGQLLNDQVRLAIEIDMLDNFLKE